MPLATPLSPLPAPPASGNRRPLSLSHLIGVGFLATQVAFVLLTHFSADDPRLLTPVEGFTRYDLHASFDRQVLNTRDIRARYGIGQRDELSLHPTAIQAVIQHREEPIPLARATLVRLRTRHNGGPEEFWLWPHE